MRDWKQKIIDEIIEKLTDRTCSFCGLYIEENRCLRQSDKWLSDCIEGHCDDWRPIIKDN